MMIDNNGKETGSKTDEEYLNEISSLIEKDQFFLAIQMLYLFSTDEKRGEAQALIDDKITKNQEKARNEGDEEINFYELNEDISKLKKIKETVNTDKNEALELAKSIKRSWSRYQAMYMFKNPEDIFEIIVGIKSTLIKRLAMQRYLLVMHGKNIRELVFKDIDICNCHLPEAQKTCAFMLQDDEDKLKIIENVEDEKIQAEIAMEALWTDEAKLKAIDIVESNYYKVKIALTLFTDKAKIEAIDKVDNDYYKEQIANSMSSSNEMLKAVDKIEKSDKNSEQYLNDTLILQDISKAESEKEKVQKATELATDEAKLEAIDMIESGENRGLVAITLSTHKARLEAIKKEPTYDYLLYAYLIIHSAQTDKEKLELMDEFGEYFVDELETDEAKLKVIDRKDSFEYEDFNVVYSLKTNEARLKAMRKLSRENQIRVLALLTTSEAKIEGINEILRNINAVDNNSIELSDFYRGESLLSGYPLIRVLSEDEDIKNVRDTINSTTNEENEMYLTDLQRAKQEIDAYLTENEEYEALSDDKKIEKIKELLRKDNKDCVLGLKLAKSLTTDEAKMEIIQFVRDKDTYGIKVFLITEIAKGLTEDKNKLKVLKSYYDGSYMNIEYMELASTLSNDESIIEAIPYLNNEYMHLALMLKTDEAKLKVLKKAGKEVEGNFDCVMRLINELTTEEARKEARDYFIKDDDYYRTIFLADERIRKENKIVPVSEEDLKANYIECGVEVSRASSIIPDGNNRDNES